MRYVPHCLGINFKYFHIPDPFIGWLPFALYKGINILKKEKIDAILSTSMPNTCHLVALSLKKRFKLPWIADFRDSWTQKPSIKYTPSILKLENKMEAAVIRNADRITAINTPICRKLAQKYPDQPSNKFITIPHGFDPHDFLNVKRIPTKKFTITYTGSFYGRRNPKNFLQAIKELVDENKKVKNDIQIQFIGNNEVVKKYMKDYNINSIIRTKGFVPHKEIFSILKGSDILLLIIGSGKDSDKISTGKIFEYMGSGTPILALIPNGVAADIIKSANIGTIVDPENIRNIKTTILEYYEKYKKNNLQIMSNKKTVQQYNVINLTKNFSNILNVLCNKNKSNNS
jgi:glycosyltransferase involved in cell wall biosynthesis